MALVVVVGAIAQAVAWAVVASGRGSVWAVVGPVIVVAGIAAAIVDAPPLSGRVPVLGAVVLGLGAGLVLYLATRAFVALVAARWWPAFGRDAQAIYRERRTATGVSPVAATAVAPVAAAAVVAIAEEVFWRGLAQRELARHVAPIVAALAALAVYVAANALGRNLAILAGALVGGAVWAGLAWATAGILASALAHATWTVLMLARPVADAA